MRWCNAKLAEALLAGILWLVLGRVAAADDQKATERHSWQSIAYPPLPCHWATKSFTPSLRNPGKNEAPGLKFRIEFHRPPMTKEEGEAFFWPESKHIQVRLHYADGTVVTSKNVTADDDVSWFGGMLGTTGIVEKTFPWGMNDFREAWIELRIPGFVYWLGIPYGFTRDPSDPLCPSEKGGEPTFAAAMQKLEEGAKIVNWQFVEYRVDPPQKGWSLTLRQSNPFYAACELILYKDDFRGEWDLFSPRTAVSIQRPNLSDLTGNCWNIRKHDDGLQRTDSFKIINVGSGKTRCWGTAIIKVDADESQVVIPSSLFHYVHGVADPHHEATFGSRHSLQRYAKTSHSWFARMNIVLYTLTVSFAALCVWLTVRIVNRRERWAKRTLVATVVGLPVIYVLSFGPACWWLSEYPQRVAPDGIAIRRAPQIYWPIGAAIDRLPRAVTVHGRYEEIGAEFGRRGSRER